MITAKEARERVENSSTTLKHLKEKMTQLIEQAIQKGDFSIVYNLAALDEMRYWNNYSYPDSCKIVCEFAQKYGYKTHTYSDNKRVCISW